MPLRKGRLHRPCIKCGRMHEPTTKTPGQCKNCLRKSKNCSDFWEDMVKLQNSVNHETRKHQKIIQKQKQQNKGSFTHRKSKKKGVCK